MSESRTKRVARGLEVAANAAIILASITVIIVFVRSLTRKPASVLPAIEAGTKLGLTDVDWRSGGRTVVLAVSTTCRFCGESLGFYAVLVSQCRRQHIRTIAVLPQPKTEAEAYLKDRGIAVDDIRQEVLSNLKIDATPTLLLVDGGGVVRSVWVGKLSRGGEKALLAKLNQPWSASR